MPKVSEEHKERRREQILDGARRCFAQHGYEGATVARLEQEIGLSRGAIFNYFPNKDALFVELAIETSRRSRTSGSTRASVPCSTRSSQRRPRLARRPVRGHAAHPHRRRVPARRRGARAGVRGHARASGSSALRPQVRDDVPLEAVGDLPLVRRQRAGAAAVDGRSAARPRRDREARRRRRRAALDGVRGVRSGHRGPVEDVLAILPGGNKGCLCQYWRMTCGEYSRASNEARREALREQINETSPPGMVAYVDGEPDGWLGIRRAAARGPARTFADNRGGGRPVRMGDLTASR